MFTEYPDVITVKELMKMLRIGKGTAFKMVNDGTIKSHKAGNRIYVTKQAVIDFLNSEDENIS